MVVSYQDVVSNGNKLFFIRILAIWKGSLYKLVWIDLLGYLIIYYIINFIYRFALINENQKRSFEEIVKFCDNMKSNIPISFLLGFFVSGVIARWFQMYLYIPWLNRLAFLIEGMVNGGDKDLCRKLRQTILRYLNLSWILCMRQVSDQIQIRFQHNDDNNEEVGVRDMFMNFNKDRKVQSTYRKIITDAEMRAFENIAAKNYSKNKTKYLPEFWVPIQWTSRLLQKAFVHGYISDPRTLNSLINDLDVLRNQMHTLQIFSGIMIPLVYTQVIIIAVYSYFLCQLFASQFVDTKSKIPGHEVDLYVPIFTVFQFLFFMGWLKVALCVMNPFGDDDEDFPTSEILDYNLEVSFRSVTADISMYPEHLEPPGMMYKPQANSKDDLLGSFMDDIDGDLEEIDAPNVEGDVTALEVKPTRYTRFINLITCGFTTSLRHNISPNSPQKKGDTKFFNKKKPSFRTQHSMYPEETREVHKQSLVQSV